MSLFSRLRRKSQREISPMFDVGFHGDKYLLSVVHSIMQMVKAFVETGTNIGSSLAYVALTYPHVQCLSCEPDQRSFEHSLKNTSGLPNVSIYNETSQTFLKRFRKQYAYLLEEDVLFWLDAHGYGFKWPLREEIAFITTNFKAAYILIDDFKVSGLDCFGYDEYKGQECSFDYIKDALNPKIDYILYYPNYTKRTSQHHPLRGWGLIEFGHNDALKVPDFVQNKVRRVGVNNLGNTSGDTN